MERSRASLKMEAASSIEYDEKVDSQLKELKNCEIAE